MSPRTPEGGQATNRVTWLKRNILLSQTPLSWGTYPAVAGYLQKGECGDGKVEVRCGKFIR